MIVIIIYKHIVIYINIYKPNISKVKKHKVWERYECFI